MNTNGKPSLLSDTIAKLILAGERAAAREEEEAKLGINNLPKVSDRDLKPQKAFWRQSREYFSELLEETQYLVEGFIPKGAVVLISGREGTMKSWLMLDMARAIAEGGSWLGRPCEAVPVLYLDAEMPYQVFVSRLHAVGDSLNLHVSRWQEEDFPTTLDDPRLIEVARTHGLIIVDTLRRFMKNLEENSASDMSKVSDWLRQLTRYGATVIVLHHSPKDPAKSGYRGSTELGAGCDLALTVEKCERDGSESIDVRVAKTRYPDDLRMRIQVIRDAQRPVFDDVSRRDEIMGQITAEQDMEVLGSVIDELRKGLKCRPNQSEIVKRAKQCGIGSRKAVLRGLRQGEGARWQSTIEGPARVYELLSPCPTP